MQRRRSRTRGSTARRRSAPRRRASCSRSATASCSSTARASSGCGTPRPRGSPGLDSDEVVGRPIDEVVPGWESCRAAIPVTEDRASRAPRRRRSRSAAASSGSRAPASARGGHGLRLPRPDRGARARADASGLRRDGLARAAHAARGDLRRRDHVPATGTRARPDELRAPAPGDHRGVDRLA